MCIAVGADAVSVGLVWSICLQIFLDGTVGCTLASAMP